MLPSRENEPSPEMVAEIRGRLAGVCRDYSDTQLDALAREIAYVRVKYDRIKTEGFFRAARELAWEERAVRPEVRPRAD